MIYPTKPAPTRLYIFALRVFAPSMLGRPPEELASEQNDGCQYQSSVNVGGDKARTKRNYWRAHCEIIRAGVAAVGASAPLCVENARRSHPAERNDPNSRSNRNWREQTGNNG